MIILHGDYRELEHELDRLDSQPSRKMGRLLDDVLDQGFMLTQAAVHVETGALKASGEKESNRSKVPAKWEGDITYGDPGGGDATVDYAIYEKERGIGGAGGLSNAKGDHDFFAPLPALHPEWVAAILTGLRP